MQVYVRKILLIPFIGLAAGLSPASAGLVGTTATVNYNWPALGDVLFSGGSALVVAGGTAFSLSDGGLEVEVNDANIEITFPNGWSFNAVDPKTFDGVVLTDDAVNITGISLNSTSTNIPYSVTDISFDSHNVEVNFPFPPFTALGAGATVSVDLTTSSIPEPSTWAMMLLGMAGLGFAARRRTRSALTIGKKASASN